MNMQEAYRINIRTIFWHTFVKSQVMLKSRFAFLRLGAVVHQKLPDQ